MNFLKNLLVIGKNSLTEFADDIELKAKAVEVKNQEKKAKAKAEQENAKQVELEKRAKAKAEQEKIKRAESLKKYYEERERKYNEKGKEREKKLKNLISSGDLEIIKTSLTSKEDALKSLSDDEFINVVFESTDEKEPKELAIDLYVKHAKLNNKDEVVNYLMTLQ